MTTFKWFGFLVLAATVVPALFAESHCPGNVVSLPFRLVNGYQIVVPVSINHSGPYDFLLDTGTQMTIVGPALADALHLKTEGAAVVAGTDGDEKVFAALPPQQVKIGSLQLPSVTFLALAYPKKDSVTVEFDGLLTMDLFRRVFISHADHFAVLEPR